MRGTMRISAITLSICLGLAVTAAAEGAPKGKAASSSRASKVQVKEIRSIVHELERLSSKLGVLLNDFRSISEQRPPKAQQKQRARWEAAFDRLLRSLQKTHAALVQTTKRLNQTTTVKLPTSLDKEVADARKGAEPVRRAAKPVLAKHKSRLKKRPKRTKKAPAASDADAHLLDDLDL